MFKFVSHFFLTGKSRVRDRKKGSIQLQFVYCFSLLCQLLFLPFLPFSYPAPCLLLPERVGRGNQGKEESSSTFHFHLWQLILELTPKNHAKLAMLHFHLPATLEMRKLRFRQGKPTSPKSHCFQGVGLGFKPRALHLQSGSSFPYDTLLSEIHSLLIFLVVLA